jgi:hypothetical protein
MLKEKIKILEGDSFGIENMYAEWQEQNSNVTIIKTECYEFGAGSQRRKVLIIFYEVWEEYYGN